MILAGGDVGIRMLIIKIMVILRCHFSREHIELSFQKRCENRILKKKKRLKALRMMQINT